MQRKAWAVMLTRRWEELRRREWGKCWGTGRAGGTGGTGGTGVGGVVAQGGGVDVP